MFHVELAPLGGILGPLKSDLGVFWAKIPLYPYNVKFSNSIFSKSANLPILSFWILNLHIIICQFQKRSTVKHFFSLSPCSCHMCPKIMHLGHFFFSGPLLWTLCDHYVTTWWPLCQPFCNCKICFRTYDITQISKLRIVKSKGLLRGGKRGGGGSAHKRPFLPTSLAHLYCRERL